MTSAFDKSQVPQVQPAPIPTYPQDTLRYSDRQFLHTQTAGVVVPLLQAFITSALLALAVLIVSFVCGWWNGWKLAVAVFGVMPLVAWVYLQRRWLVLTAERVFQRDFDGGGSGVSPGSASAEPHVVKVQVNHIREGGHLQVDLMDLPCTASQLQKLAEGLLNGVPFIEGAWKGKYKPFSEAEFRNLRDVMLARELIKMRSVKDTRQGFELTEEGWAVMKGAL